MVLSLQRISAKVALPMYLTVFLSSINHPVDNPSSYHGKYLQLLDSFVVCSISIQGVQKFLHCRRLPQ